MLNRYSYIFLLLLSSPCGGFNIECTFSYGTLFVFIYGFITISQLAEIVIQCRLWDTNLLSVYLSNSEEIKLEIECIDKNTSYPKQNKLYH